MEVIKASAQRQEATSLGGAARLLPTWTQQQCNIVGKICRWHCAVLREESFLRSNHHNDDLTSYPWANQLAFINTTTHKHAHSKHQMQQRLLWQRGWSPWHCDGRCWYFVIAALFLPPSLLGAVLSTDLRRDMVNLSTFSPHSFVRCCYMWWSLIPGGGLVCHSISPL